MNTHPKIRVSPEKEIEILAQITAGLAASGCFILSPDDFDADNLLDNPVAVLRSYGKETPGPDGTTRITGAMLITDVAHAILDQLRWDVEKHVEESPESYRDLAAS